MYFKENKNFYPTPKKLIERMLKDVDFRFAETILEPSAGKGDIVDYINSECSSGYHSREYDIDCIEIDKNLQHILKGKEYRVVYNDFLSYETEKRYDLIVMNPPYDQGAAHLLKAIKMQERNGGAVISLLNAETIFNLCTNERIALKRLLDEYEADIEILEDAFGTGSDAERRTDVKVALIKVKLPAVKEYSVIFDNLHKAKEEREYKSENTQYLAENDLIKSIVAQYKIEVEAGIKFIKEYYGMRDKLGTCFVRDDKTNEVKQSNYCILELKMQGDNYGSSLSINNFVRAVREKYWSALFDNPIFVGKLTGNLRNEYAKRIKDLRNYEFSEFNIYEIKNDMNKHITSSIEDEIVNLFDELSNKYHYYDETSKNIHYFNGWKTNKSYIINNKVVVPLDGYSYSYYNGKKDLDLLKYNGAASKLADIEKCFNYLDGGRTENVDLTKELRFAQECEQSKNIRLKYFNVTFYKKGTCHISFTNEELLKKFNIFGSQHKGWLPPSYGKKKYKDMTEEEKDVVNSFEGEVAYASTFANADYFIARTEDFLLESKAV